jgi:hypothetical protein
MMCNISNLDTNENETNQEKNNYYEKDLNSLYSINSIQLISLQLKLAWKETISQIFKSFQLIQSHNDNNSNISSEISISNTNVEDIILQYDSILKNQYNDDIKDISLNNNNSINTNILNSHISYNNKVYIDNNDNNSNDIGTTTTTAIITPIPPVLPKTQASTRPGRKLFVES